jgi:uncharacterized membrane protein YbhN (UPF0104 family)
MKLNILKFFFSLTLFVIIIRISNINLNDNFINVNNFTILLFTTLLALIVISIRNNVIYNFNNKLKFKEIFIFTIRAWSLSNFFFSGVSELLKIFFFKMLSKNQILSFILIEKFITLFTLTLIITTVCFLFYFITNDYFFFYTTFYLIILLLVLLIVFEKNFFLSFYPYLNILSYDFDFSKKKFFTLKKNLKISLAIILLHFLSFTSFVLILFFSNLNISIFHLFILYFIHYLSGLFQIFPSGIGIRELSFFVVANTINLDVEKVVHLSIVFTSFNIFFSTLILVLIYIFSRLKFI